MGIRAGEKVQQILLHERGHDGASPPEDSHLRALRCDPYSARKALHRLQLCSQPQKCPSVQASGLQRYHCRLVNNWEDRTIEEAPSRMLHSGCRRSNSVHSFSVSPVRAATIVEPEELRFSAYSSFSYIYISLSPLSLFFRFTLPLP